MILPPPREATAAARAALEGMWKGSKERYLRLFLRGEPVRGLREEFQPLVDCGIARRDWLGRTRACARVFPFFGRFIATDLLSHDAPDQVFSLMFEQVYLMRNSTIRDGDDVLELCSGSGANCICAADLARSVTGTDISPRALAFSAFNAALNPPRRPPEFRAGSLFEPLPRGATFDAILFNPPFEIAPGSEPFFLHSHGGEDGLDVIRAALREAPRRLRPGGRFEIVTFSPGSDDDPHLLGLLEEAFPDARIEVHLLDEEPVAHYTRRFRDDAWVARLGEQGITRIYFLYVRILTGAGRGRRMHSPHDEIARCRAIAAEWE